MTWFDEESLHRPDDAVTQEDLHGLQVGTLPCQAIWKFWRDDQQILASQRLLAGSQVKIAYGTDCGMFPFSHGILEFQAMVNAGLSPTQPEAFPLNCSAAMIWAYSPPVS